MDAQSIGTGVVGLGIIVASIHNGWQTAQAKRAAKRTEATLTTNNGGSHVKDSLDRLEAGMHELREDFRDHKADARAEQTVNDRRLAALEYRPPTLEVHTS